MVWLMKIVKAVLLSALGLLLYAWSFGAIYYCSFPETPQLRLFASSTYLVLNFLILILGRRKLFRAYVVTILLFLAVAIWFAGIKPKTNAMYPKDLAMAHADFQGDRVTLYGVRNIDYRTAKDSDVRYETREYNLSDLKTLDVLVNYWGTDLIAHTFLSFGFSGGRYLAVSVEYRPEVGETYGTWKGLFKQYEIIYVWADERDLIRVRTNYRGEDVYLYRAHFTPEQVRKLFIHMLGRTNLLCEKPEFYNTATQSCTNTLGNHLLATGMMDLPFWKRRLRTGDVDSRLYKEGLLETMGHPFPELRALSKINDSAKMADRDKLFSDKIRSHLRDLEN